MRDGQFGFRYHCGEADQQVADNYLKMHMGASSAVICAIVESVKWDPTVDPPPLRIGHGIAFRHYLHLLGDSDPHKITIQSIEALDHLQLYISRALWHLREKRIPIELNLTSNHYLEGNAEDTELLKIFLCSKLTVVLATDNDGIWPTKQGDFLSVAGEFFSAITGKLTKPDFTLLDNEVESIINSYYHASFTKGKFWRQGINRTFM